MREPGWMLVAAGIPQTLWLTAMASRSGSLNARGGIGGVPVVLQSGLKPGKIGGIDVLVGPMVTGFRHTRRVWVVNGRTQSLTTDAAIQKE